MNFARFRLLLLLMGLASVVAAQPQPSTQPGTSASGIIIGRSGKPLANARVFVGVVRGDEDVVQARIVLKGYPNAQADAQGRIKLTGFEPGNSYTLVYYLAGTPPEKMADFSIKSLSSTIKSTMPLMKGVEIGGHEVLPERPWGNAYTLLKGHRFWGNMDTMKIWNATARRGVDGPYVEMRKGRIVFITLADKGEFKFDAWSF